MINGCAPIRTLPNWIAFFLEETDGLPSPELFRRWAAIACLAAVMERKVWAQPYPRTILHPNLYTILVGPPGGGKSVALGQTEILWRALDPDGTHVAPTSITKAALIDSLNAAICKPEEVILAGSFEPYNSLKVPASELGVLLPSYDTDFMNTLTTIYDGNPYSERRRTKDLHIQIPRPQFNILAGTTPSYLNSFMPEGAWEQGFISRCILIYSSDRTLKELFQGSRRPLDPRLLEDLTHIAGLYGEMTFDPDAAEAIAYWHSQGGEPTPTHPRLSNYCMRRTSHLIKLCMVLSAARTSELRISLPDYCLALDWLVEAEASMPSIFAAMEGGSDVNVMKDAFHFVLQSYGKGAAPIPEASLFAFISQRTPAFNAPKVMDAMIRAGQIQPVYQASGTFFKPNVRPIH